MIRRNMNLAITPNIWLIYEKLILHYCEDKFNLKSIKIKILILLLFLSFTIIYLTLWFNHKSPIIYSIL